MTLKGLKAI